MVPILFSFRSGNREMVPILFSFRSGKREMVPFRSGKRENASKKNPIIG